MYNVTLARLPRKQVPRDPLATGSLRDVARLRVKKIKKPWTWGGG
ncbi:Uncharacterized protein APZ42_027178 [Daphnia magna]|uniref:Uncharacterized protein n=1 Tax=Daphnia magna TaxID=35525 RepID=A0A164RBX7_9CRUS|nr:Uncharacterized protein APZ42_027178 [Daphnia magna]